MEEKKYRFSILLRVSATTPSFQYTSKPLSLLQPLKKIQEHISFLVWSGFACNISQSVDFFKAFLNYLFLCHAV